MVLLIISIDTIGFVSKIELIQFLITSLVKESVVQIKFFSSYLSKVYSTELASVTSQLKLSYAEGNSSNLIEKLVLEFGSKNL
jgi:hypothetical protein